MIDRKRKNPFDDLALGIAQRVFAHKAKMFDEWHPEYIEAKKHLSVIEFRIKSFDCDIDELAKKLQEE